MNVLRYIILGIIQGLTEFLPVSSSGHLVIFQEIFNMNQPGVLLEIVVHVGTLIAVLVYFKEDLYKLIISLFNWKKNRTEKVNFYHHIFFYIIIASVVTLVISLLLKKQFELFFEQLSLVGIMLIVTGLILFISDKVRNYSKNRLNLSASIIIGFAQSIAIIPGISRSGATITAGIFTGLNRDLAIRFSFLLSIPAILGAVIFKIKEFSNVTQITGLWFLYLMATITSAIVGYLSIKLLIKMIKKVKLFYFSIYCWILGIFIILFSIFS